MRSISFYLLGLILFFQLQNCKEKEKISPSSIILTASSLNALTGESITFTVKTNLGVNVTSQAVILVNGTAIKGTEYLASSTGSFSIKATYSGLTSNVITLNISTTTPKSITLTSNNLKALTGEAISFKVTTDLGIDVTSQATILVNNTKISGQQYTATAAGNYSVKATYSGLTSNIVVLNISTPTPKSIILTSNKPNALTGEIVTFIVKTDLGTDVTSQSAILVNNAKITGQQYSATSAGNYSVKATYSGLTSNIITISISQAPPSSITLTANKTAALTGEVVTFTVKTNEGTDVTSQATIAVNNTNINGPTYSTNTPAAYSVKATFMGVNSNEINLIVSAPPSTIKFVKRVLLEDFTGTWCGFCPAIPFRLNELSKKTNLVVPVAIHVGGDPYNAEALARPLIAKYTINSAPTVILDRKKVEIGPSSKFDESALALTSPKSDVGIAMSSTLSGTNVNLTVNAKFNSAHSGLSLVVMVLEDNLIHDQTNYTDFYGGQSIIKNFVNNDVLRALLTKSIMGEPITEVIPAGFELTKKFTYTIPSTYQKDKLHFVAFILNSSNAVVNVRSVKLSESQSYEY